MYTKEQITILDKEWKTNPRWKGLIRPYTADKVIQLQGSIPIDYSIARLGANKLWTLFEKELFIRAISAVTGNQAVQQVQAGLKAVYVSGWQVAADGNDSFQMYPDKGLYPTTSVPTLIQRINNALLRADQIEHSENITHTDWLVPIIADAEAGFGGPLNTFELVKAYIAAGVSALHIEDQLSAHKKCGHVAGKVIVPLSSFIEKLVSARFAADVMSVPTLIFGRTDSESAAFIHSDSDPVDHKYFTGKKTSDGFLEVKGSLEYAISRALKFAPYCDVVWCETSKPDVGQAREFAQAIHEKFPGKWLAYNCSPSFNWQSLLNNGEALLFQEKLGAMGYKFQFITLAGFHTINASMFELAHRYKNDGMAAYAEFQNSEFALEKLGFKALKHQHFVGTSYFDTILETVTRPYNQIE